MWVAVKRAGWLQRVLKVTSLWLWRRLVVVAPTRQWLCRWQSVECPTKSQWGAAWGQLCQALQSCKLVPAWDPRHGRWPGSSQGCLASTGRVQWTLESPAAVVGQCQERGELGRYTAGTRTCHQQYGAWLAASAVSVARPGNNEHGHLCLAQHMCWRHFL